MRKLSIILLSTSMLFCLKLDAQRSLALQQPSPTHFVGGQKTINGYTVKLIPAKGVGYGYDILQGGNLLVHQDKNPLLFNHKGIQNKEDAFAVAEWLIQQHGTHGMWRNAVPPHIVRQLKIKS